MTKITNNTASPYDLPGVDGPVRLPAFGSVEGEFSGEYLEILAASQVVTIEQADSAVDDKGGEDALRAEYESLAGKPADKRWNEKRLRQEVDKLLEA